MSKLPTVTGGEAIKAFEQIGFCVVRIKGSHHIMKKEGYISLLTVPVHSGQTLERGTLRSLINAAGITADEFVDLAK